MKPVVFLFMVIALFGHRILDAMPFKTAGWITVAAWAALIVLLLHDKVTTWKRMREYKRNPPMGGNEPEWSDCGETREFLPGLTIECTRAKNHDGRHESTSLGWDRGGK